MPVNIGRKGREGNIYSDERESIFKHSMDSMRILKLNFWGSNNHSTISECQNYKEGGLVSKWIYKYDEIGNVILVDIYDNKGCIIKKEINIYNNKQNVIINILQDYLTIFDECKNDSSEYKYDLSNNIIEKKYSKNGNKYIYISSYDINVNKIKSVCFKNNFVCDSVTYDYQIDRNSNWIKKIKTDYKQSLFRENMNDNINETKEDKITYIINERTIEYY